MFEIKVKNIIWKNGNPTGAKAVEAKAKDDLITHITAADTGETIALKDATDEQLGALAQFFSDVIVRDLEKKLKDKVVKYDIDIYYSDGTVLDKINTKKFAGKIN